MLQGPIYTYAKKRLQGAKPKCYQWLFPRGEMMSDFLKAFKKNVFL